MRTSVFGSVVLTLTVCFATACGDSGSSGSDAAGAGGGEGTGGSGSGGASSGGGSTGGASSGGTSTGASDAGGASSGGATGGDNFGGAGGTATGGASSTGGDNMGGAGTGGDNMGGAAGNGTGGGSSCDELTAGSFREDAADGSIGVYSALSSPDHGDAVEDRLRVELYGPNFGPFNGDEPGTYDLTDEGNYATCARCVLLGQDANGKVFYAQSGTLVVDDTSDPMDGTLNGSLTDVTLVEVTIDGETWTSTPVPDGECRHVASATIQVGTVVPAAWNCNNNFYGDGSCDCGCGALDIDCADNTPASCEWCGTEGSCSDQSCTGLDPQDNSVCVLP